MYICSSGRRYKAIQMCELYILLLSLLFGII